MNGVFLLYMLGLTLCIPKTDPSAQPRKLALLVGVGTYLNQKIPSLKAPTNDVDLMTAILTGPNGYGFKPQDVWILKDKQATLANFRHFFEKKLILKSQPEDVVLFFSLVTDHKSTTLTEMSKLMERTKPWFFMIPAQTDERT